MSELTKKKKIKQKRIKEESTTQQKYQVLRELGREKREVSRREETE